MKDDLLNIIEHSVLNKGNNYLLKKAINKGLYGQKVSLGFLGGSVTAGNNASKGNSYVDIVSEYWKTKFNDNVDIIKAGKGATDSVIGAFRLCDEVLDFKPDVLFLDFSVNDELDSIHLNSYESIVKNAISSGCAVVLLCLCRCDGSSCAKIHRRIGKYYDLPILDTTISLYESIKTNVISWDWYSNDKVHPTNEGHRLLGNIIINYLEVLIKEDPDDYPILPLQLSKCGIIKNTIRLDSSNYIPKEFGSFAGGYNNFFQYKNGWISSGTDAFEFKIECKKIYLVFLKNPDEASGSALIDVNNNTIVFNTHFKNGWGKYAKPVCVFSSNSKDEVNVSIRSLCADKHIVLLHILIDL